MARAHSLDLRERLVAAVMAGELSRRQAAARFGVAVKTANKWLDRFNETGSAAASKMGGQKPKKIAGAHADWPRHRCRERAFTLRGLASELASERGLKVDDRSVWEIVHAKKLSYKQRRWSPVSAITATSPGGGHNDPGIRAVSTRPAWCPLMVRRDRGAVDAA